MMILIKGSKEKDIMDYEIIAREGDWEIMIDGSEGYLVNDELGISQHIGVQMEVREIVESLGVDAAISYYMHEL